jgi:proteasome lid subunit RPN8/RPN11
MLIIPEELKRQMEAHLQACLPNEGCGLLLGIGSTAKMVMPITNILASPTRFRMDAIELLTALRQIEANDLLLLAIFHSHPSGESVPSPTDLSEYLYPESFMLVFSQPEWWKMLAFKVKDGRFEEFPVQLA